MISISRSRRASAEMRFGLVARRRRNRRDRGETARRRSGRSTFTATACAMPSVSISAAMHLRDRGRRHRWAEARKGLRQRPFQRRRDHGLGFALRKRRQPVLQAFQIARHGDADDVGPRRKELSELDDRPARAASARATAAGRISRRRRSISRASRSANCPGGGTSEGSTTPNTPSRANTKPARASRATWVERRDHKRQPECNATMPPDRRPSATRAKAGVADHLGEGVRVSETCGSTRRDSDRSRRRR